MDGRLRAPNARGEAPGLHAPQVHGADLRGPVSVPVPHEGHAGRLDGVPGLPLREPRAAHGAVRLLRPAHLQHRRPIREEPGEPLHRPHARVRRGRQAHRGSGGAQAPEREHDAPARRPGGHRLRGEQLLGRLHRVPCGRRHRGRGGRVRPGEPRDGARAPRALRLPLEATRRQPHHPRLAPGRGVQVRLPLPLAHRLRARAQDQPRLLQARRHRRGRGPLPRARPRLGALRREGREARVRRVQPARGGPTRRRGVGP